MMHRRINIAVLLLCVIAFHARAQQKIKATVDRTTILVGEPIQLTLEISSPRNQPAHFPKIDTIPHFEVVSKEQPDSSSDATNNIYTWHWTITSYDSGYWTIPSFAIRDGKKIAHSDSLKINVTYSPSDPKQDYHDIKDIIPVEKPVDYWMWIIGGAGLLLLAVAAYFYFRKKKPAPIIKKEPVSKLSPFDEAMESLKELAKYDSDDARVKQYFTGLNDVLRMYMKRCLGVATMERTNEELILQLRKTRLSDEEFTRIAQELRMNDFVRFAKYVPPVEDRREALNIIKSTIIKLEEVNRKPSNAV